MTLTADFLVLRRITLLGEGGEPWGDLAAESMRELDKSNISAQKVLTGIICDL
jgi:hypothetical protein